jgi:purine-binding chemotaxis protein CheW
MGPIDPLTTAASAATETSQYLTFRLADEQYGVEILKVQEIKGYSAITPVPNTPDYIRGVMNLRGSIIPIVDLRTKLGMAVAECNQFTVVIVIRVGAKTVGLVVDAVSDVLDIARDDIQESPDFGASVDARFIAGMARTGDHLVVLLDIDEVLGEPAAAVVAAA